MNSVDIPVNTFLTFSPHWPQLNRSTFARRKVHTGKGESVGITDISCYTGGKVYC